MKEGHPATTAATQEGGGGVGAAHAPPQEQPPTPEDGGGGRVGVRLVPSELRAAGKVGTDGILANDAFREDSSLTRMVLPEPRSRGGTGKKCRRREWLTFLCGSVGLGEEV